jgi:two-component system, OmpR family, response regulator
MTRILVVDDDQHIRELIRHFFLLEGWEIIEAVDGLHALSILSDTTVDLVVLDIMMPGMDGWELCRELRKQADLPLLMLTAKGGSSEIVKGFGLGTDDYLVKPFDPMVLVVRVKALLKRYRIQHSQSVELGEVTLRRDSFQCFAGKQELLLPLKEFELLFTLASFPGKTFTRDQLIEKIWGFDYEGDDRTVDVHIKRLRERFPEEQHVFRIRTIRGLGYRLEVKP